MRLRDITNSKCDVRKYMSIEISDEVRYELENWDYDVDDVLRQARIYIDGHKLDDEIIPFNVEKSLELNSDQQVVLDWLKEVNKRTTRSTPFGIIYGVINSYEAFIRAKLSKEEQFQVLAAFAEWGMKEEEE